MHRLCDAFVSPSASGLSSVIFLDMFTSLPVVFVEQRSADTTKFVVFNQNEFVLGSHVLDHFEIPGRLLCSADRRTALPTGIVELL